ncbi:BT0820 family HAD-type phosphatase [uncultured Draconibacterium sp.]|uniref:BT0820 family HAD-type phosphatase n=1 Tax=uncultured Draconibacterium sp. TaxID=1573823 RepID=UPI0029C66CB5|nr:HAD family hydrolase [uncultured Draconibacterium sp.]
MKKSLTIAVDFDGTIVEHKYPRIGNELPFATDTLKTLAGKGHKLILWTYRAGKELDEAIEFCSSKGLEFYAVNKSYPEEKMNDKISRKILADLYIDDRNFGGMPSWTEIYYHLHPEEKMQEEKPKKKSWWRK